MKLETKYFDKIVCEEKKVEMRLLDEKRRLIELGDQITFSDIHNPEKTIITKVVRLSIFRNFQQLYDAIDIDLLGYNTKEEKMHASYHDMEFFYPLEKQEKYGVVGIWIDKINNYPNKD